MDEGHLSLVSLNAFGIPFYLSWRRLQRLAARLDQLDADVICLQEVQQNSYTALLQRCLPNHPYRATFPHVYAPKGGLETHSRMPFVNTRFVPYRDRGLRYLMTLGDWGLYKGVLICELQLSDLRVFVLNTHLNANYFGRWSHSNPLARIQQRQVDTIGSVLDGVPPEAMVVLCGDFNFPRDAFLYDDVISRNGLIDPLREDPRPTFRPFQLAPSAWTLSLDYLLLRLPTHRHVSVEADIIDIEDEDASPGPKRFLSDHCLLRLELRWEHTPARSGAPAAGK